MRQNAQNRKISPMYMESATGRTNLRPILAVAFDGQFLSFGLCSRLLRKLSDGEREQIVSTIEKILKETRRPEDDPRNDSYAETDRPMSGR